MAYRQLLNLFVFSFIWVLLVSPANSRPENVTLSLYYETLCPFCADFIVNHLVKVFDKGLISIVNLRLLPWGNAWIQRNSTAICQHGPDECMLNTIEACAIATYPDLARHFSFIHCVERLTLENRHTEWINCFEMTKLNKTPINCYTSGYGKVLEQRYATETAQLNPPHRFVPWVVVNDQPILEDYNNFISYVCKAYKGTQVPGACRSLLLNTNSLEKANPINNPVCYANEDRN